MKPDKSLIFLTVYLIAVSLVMAAAARFAFDMPWRMAAILPALAAFILGGIWGSEWSIQRDNNHSSGEPSRIARGIIHDKLTATRRGIDKRT